jgi:hypothetical protein
MSTENLRSVIERRTTRIPMSGCWLWEGSVQSRGYGDLRLDKCHYTAHRASYLAFVGEVPDGMHVCHKCDVRLCCNPAHLFLGSNSDNIADSMRKGRRKGITRRRPSGLIYKNSRR